MKSRRQQVMKRKALSRRYTGRAVAFCFFISLLHTEFLLNIEREHKTKLIKIKIAKDNDRNFLLVRRWLSTRIWSTTPRAYKTRVCKEYSGYESLTETKWLPESQLIKILHNSRKHRPLVWWSHSEKRYPLSMQNTEVIKE